ncbi:MAG: MucR family transcriptional regulator [Caulobacteraceae bacterium]
MTETVETAALAADIVAAYVGNNKLSIGELPELISSVHKALQNAGAPQPEPAPVPAVPVKKSVTSEYLISLEDGRRYKSLKRHLATRGMTPDEYRTKWGLPKDYPMVAASYSAQRSNLAKTLGLGRKAQPAPAPAAPEPKAKAAKATKAPAATPARRRSKTAA